MNPEREVTRDLLLWSRATCHGFLLQLKLRVTYNTLCSFPHVVLMHCSHALTSLWLLLSSFSRMRSVTSSEMWAATSRLMELMRLMISGAILCPTTFFASRKSSPISATTNCRSVSSERSCGHALMLWDTMRSELSCRNHTTHMSLTAWHHPPSPCTHLHMLLEEFLHEGVEHRLYFPLYSFKLLCLHMWRVQSVCQLQCKQALAPRVPLQESTPTHVPHLDNTVGLVLDLTCCSDILVGGAMGLLRPLY